MNKKAAQADGRVDVYIHNYTKPILSSSNARYQIVIQKNC